MTATCVYIHVKHDGINDFIRETSENQEEAIKEPGNFRFDFLQMEDDPDKFLLYEVFESEESAAAHKNTVHYLKWRDAVKDLMAEPRQGIKYNLI